MRKLPYTLVLITALVMPLLPLVCFGQAPSEICDNGRDDDRDGFTDLNDPDCTCTIIQPK